MEFIVYRGSHSFVHSEIYCYGGAAEGFWRVEVTRENGIFVI